MDHRDGAVTLHDVAREAGVAVSTASRALSNPGRVSPRTREHVQEVARRLDYRPNRIAQALPSGRTHMLAILVPDITNPHNFGLIRGSEAQGRAAGFTLIIADTQLSPQHELAHLHRLTSVVDGFVLAGTRLSDADLARVRRLAPMVLFSREAPEFPSVMTDSAQGSRQVIEHLAALGHRSVAYLAGPANAWMDGIRWGALAEHAERTGIRITRLGPFSPTLENGSAAADVGLASGATALVAFNDLLAIGMLRRLEHRGVVVPRDVPVVGYDDIFGSDFCRPALTTVSSPAEQAGRDLVDLLLGIRPGDPAARVVLPVQLVVRDSTGPPLDSRFASGHDGALP